MLFRYRLINVAAAADSSMIVGGTGHRGDCLAADYRFSGCAESWASTDSVGNFHREPQSRSGIKSAEPAQCSLDTYNREL